MQDYNSTNWWTLTPQLYTMNYSLGTFTNVGSPPIPYCPIYFASAVLPDGTAIVEGGEYNSCGPLNSPGGLFHPATNVWQSIAQPPGWSAGDAQSVVLPEPTVNPGQFMMATCCALEAAAFDPTTLSWTVLTPGMGYNNKNDGSNDEEGWTLLPNGNVLTVDAYVGSPCSSAKESETFNAATGNWSLAGNTPVQLWDSHFACGCTSSTNEIGPAVLMYNGKVLATGANTCANSMGGYQPAHTALSNTATGKWSKGPNIPNGNDMADAPAAVLITGHVLVDTNPGYGNSPSTFYLYNPDGNSFITGIPQPPGLTENTEGGRLLLLPNGHALFTQAGTNSMWFFVPSGSYKPAWQPQICNTVNLCYPATAQVGGTNYTVMGTQFNGLSQGGFFGDDAQEATNYPLAVITNAATGHQFFARTHSFSTMGVATGAASTWAEFDVLPGTESGNSSLTLYTNGIPSNTVGYIYIKPGGAPGAE